MRRVSNARLRHIRFGTSQATCAQAASDKPRDWQCVGTRLVGSLEHQCERCNKQSASTPSSSIALRRRGEVYHAQTVQITRQGAINPAPTNTCSSGADCPAHGQNQPLQCRRTIYLSIKKTSYKNSSRLTIIANIAAINSNAMMRETSMLINAPTNAPATTKQISSAANTAEKIPK